MAYFPNSSAGEVFDEQCCYCPMGEDPCPTALVQMTMNYNQIGNKDLREAMGMLVDDDGTCLTRKLLRKHGLVR